MALPQGAFLTCKVREQFKDQDLIIARMRAANNADKADNIRKLTYHWQQNVLHITLTDSSD